METEAATRSTEIRYLTRPGGRIAYDVDGTGPLVMLVPGMGDLRATYRFVAPALREAGYRVAATDLRGHGDSDTSFATYGDAETAADVGALIAELGGPAVIVGNSMGAGAAVIVAAEHPDLVRGLVLVGPFVRNGSTSGIQRLLFRLAMAPMWAPMVWKSYLPKLYAGTKPADFAAYRDQVVAALHRPGHAKAFSRTTHLNHDVAEARLGEVNAPVLVIMGADDTDFPDPKAEAEWIATTLHGSALIVPDAGHYPQSQQPEATNEAVIAFAGGLGAHA
jgi:pimeloyl-ACP methyl ester carboxylesterase